MACEYIPGPNGTTRKTLRQYFIFKYKQHLTNFNNPDERWINSIWKSNIFEVPLLQESLLTLSLRRVIKKHASAPKRSRALFSALHGRPALFSWSPDGGFVFSWSCSGAVPVQRREVSEALGACTCLKSNAAPSAPKPWASNASLCQAAWLFPRHFQSHWVKQKLHNSSLFSRNEMCLPQSLSS